MTYYEELYIQFLYYFNIERDYYECHEVMEHLWLEQGRNRTLQGLLQIAVGLYHFRNGNSGGARKSFQAAILKLEKNTPITMGIHMEKLINDTKIYLSKLLDVDKMPFTFYDLDIEIVDESLQQLVEAYLECPPKPLEDQ